jgi:hypothetical protein
LSNALSTQLRARLESKLVFEHKLSGGRLQVAMAGKIDGSFDPREILAAAAAAATVVVDLAGIRTITSEGVRAFEQFIHAPELRRVVLVQLSSAVAHQLAMIPLLGQGVFVESARLPFACPACGDERMHAVAWRPGAHHDAPTCPCGTRMALDGMPEQYLPSADA